MTHFLVHFIANSWLTLTVIKLKPVVLCTISVCHAEMNAIMNKNSADVKGCTIYVALFPCNECAKLIIQSGKHLFSGC